MSWVREGGWVLNTLFKFLHSCIKFGSTLVSMRPKDGLCWLNYSAQLAADELLVYGRNHSS